MSLFKKIKETKTALKVLAYGGTGTGKTLFGLSFPEIAIIDSENGTTFYRDNPNLISILETTSAIDVEEALGELEDIKGIKTLVLDSETKIYENLQHSALDLCEKRARKKGQDVKDANISQREWGKIKLINKRIQSGKIMLASQGVNIVSIAQEKPIKEKKGDNWVTVGYEPDTAKAYSYDYDIVVRLYVEEDKKTGEFKYFAKVIKDRTRKYKKGDIIENPSFKNWEEVYSKCSVAEESKVDYRSDIEKDSKATESEIETSEMLVAEFKELYKNLEEDDAEKTKDKIKELGISIKGMQNEEIDILKQLLDYVKSL